LLLISPTAFANLTKTVVERSKSHFGAICKRKNSKNFDTLTNVLSPKERFYEIDLLRFIAALAVVFFHYTFRGYAADDLSPVSFPALAPFSKYGYYGVDLFFMISGFVILLTAYGKSAKAFSLSRIQRLYPAFWICCTLTFLFITLSKDATFQQSITTYVINLSMFQEFIGVNHVDGAYWSLTVELKFYLLILALIVFKQIKNIRVFALIWLALGYLQYVGVGNSLVDFLFISSYCSYFIAGMMFYLIRKDGFKILDGLIIAASYFLSLGVAVKTGAGQSIYYQSPFNSWVIVILITGFYLIFWAIATRQTRSLQFKWFSYLGVMTYPLYLIHQNIGYLLLKNISINKYLLLISLGLYMFSLAYAIHILVEKPLAKGLGKLMSPSSSKPAVMLDGKRENT
jgi:peptidoglycan/LPS O-acetylase OafA/YrhL